MNEKLKIINPNSDPSEIDFQEGFGFEPGEGKEWQVVIVKKGLSKNNNYWTKESLRKGIEFFDGADVTMYEYPKDFLDHLDADVAKETPEGIGANVVGWIEDPFYSDSKEALMGTFKCADESLRKKLKNAYEENKYDFLGCSVDLKASTHPGSIKGKKVDVIDEILKVRELTMVSKPAAGGQIERLVASQLKEEDDSTMEKEQIINLIKEIDESLLEGKDLQEIDRDALLKILFNALNRQYSPNDELEGEEDDSEEEKTKTDKAEVLTEKLNEFLNEIPKDKKEAVLPRLRHLKDLIEADEIDKAVSELDQLMTQVEENPGSVYGRSGAYGTTKKYSEDTSEKEEEDRKTEAEKDETLEEMKLINCRMRLKEAVKDLENDLPAPIIKKLQKQFEGQVFEEDELQEAIGEYKDLLASMSESGDIKMPDQEREEISTGKNKEDKLQIAFHKMIDPNTENYESDWNEVPAFSGIREAWKEYTDQKNTVRITEATTSDFSTALGTSITRKMVKEYKEIEKVWEDFCTVTEVDNFKQQDVVRWGSFANLSSVSEGSSFAEFSNEPNEENPTYTAGKYGNLWVVTREMILNDDKRYLQRAPIKLARAAARTLSQFVWDLVLSYTSAINDTNIYDTNTLYDDANHQNNKLTSALSYDSLNSAINVMMNFQDVGDAGGKNEIVGIRPKFLVFPPDLRSTALSLVQSPNEPGSMDNDVNVNKGKIEPLLSFRLRGDTNNWYLLANPADLDYIELGFVEGEEEPVILQQTSETAGTNFTADKFTYKVRHEYGGAVTDYRGFVGSIVA